MPKKKLKFHDEERQGKEEVTVLRDKATGERFRYNVCKDKSKNQKRYVELGEAVKDYVHDVCLEGDLKLLKIAIPVEAGKTEPQGFFFMSEYACYFKKLMILVHGGGAVRAGQWARSLIINENLESGTMVPYIKRALEEGFGVILTNGNHNKDSNGRPIQGSESAEDHFVYLWDNFIKNAKAEDIVIVAHSLGGEVVLHGLKNIDEAMRRIKAVAFTASTHTTNNESMNVKAWLNGKAKNWVTSDKPLDTPVKINCQDDADQVSAGTTEHPMTSHFAKDSIFNFFEGKLNAKNASSFVKPTQFSLISPKHRPLAKEKVYKMTSSPRGLAVLVMMRKFAPEARVEDLEGSEFDVDGLAKLFKGLDFTTKTLVDLTKAALVKEFEEIVEHLRVRTYDCLVVCITSHGDENSFIATDGEEIEIQSLREIFNNGNCEKLVGKPKLFFIDACRGVSVDSGTVKKGGSTLSGKPPPSPKLSRRTPNQKSSGKTTGENTDMLTAFSSFEGYASFIESEKGSWFFSSMIEVFREYAGEEDVMTMLTRVNKEVDSKGGLGEKQVPQPNTTLTKEVFFWPGMKF